MEKNGNGQVGNLFCQVLETRRAFSMLATNSVTRSSIGEKGDGQIRSVAS